MITVFFLFQTAVDAGRIGRRQIIKCEGGGDGEGGVDVDSPYHPVIAAEIVIIVVKG